MSSEATTSTGSVVVGGLRPGDGAAANGHVRTAFVSDPPLAGGPDGPTGRRAARIAGVIALVVMVFASLAIVGIAASRASFVSPPSRVEFPGWMAGPLGWIGRGAHPSIASLKVILSCSIGAMFLAYLVVLSSASRLRARWAIGGIVVLQVVFFLSPPLSLTDVFNYMNYGRMEILHGLNPYTTIPALGPPGDPTFALSNWHQLLSPYGPLFTIFSFALVPLGVAAGFWVLKASLMIAGLATLWLVWRCAELLGRDPLGPTLFVGLNPLVLVWGFGGDHNDFFMVFFVMLAVYLLLRARALRFGLRGGSPGSNGTPLAAGSGGVAVVGGSGGVAVVGGGLPRGSRWSRLLSFVDGAPRPPAAGEAGPAREFGAGFVLIAAVAIKASAGILLPVVLLGAARRFRLLGGMAAGAIVFGGASLYAFGPHLPNLAQQSTLVTLAGIPNVVGTLLGLGGETDGMKTVLVGLLVLAAIGGAFWALGTRRWIEASGFVTLILLVTLSWTLPWYVLWLLPLAALARGRSLRVAAIVVSAYLMVVWIPNMTDVIHALNYKPSLTRLGQERQQKTLLLLH